MPRPRFLAFLIPGLIPLVIAGFAVTAGAPPVTSIAILGIAYTMMLGVYFSERIATESPLRRGAEAILRNARALGFTLTRKVNYRGQSAVLKIASQSGVCPLGLVSGTTWEISGSGRLNRPICRPAAVAMGLVLEDGDPQALEACVCPRGPQTVSFAVQPQST